MLGGIQRMSQVCSPAPKHWFEEYFSWLTLLCTVFILCTYLLFFSVFRSKLPNISIRKCFTSSPWRIKRCGGSSKSRKRKNPNFASFGSNWRRMPVSTYPHCSSFVCFFLRVYDYPCLSCFSPFQPQLLKQSKLWRMPEMLLSSGMKIFRSIRRTWRSRRS